MLTITSPKYSFITVTEIPQLPSNYHEQEFLFPILDIDELRFEIFVVTDREDLLPDIHILENVSLTQIGHFTFAETDTGFVGYPVWDVDTDDLINLVGTGDCFRMLLDYATGEISDPTANLYFNNFFKVVTSIKHTALLQYWNECDEHDFVYDGGVVLYNQLRLPVIMSSFELPAKRKVYRKSTGQYKRLSSILSRLWRLQADYMTENQVMDLGIAMEHDNVFFQDERGVWHRLFMPESESIRPEWIDQHIFNFRQAQVKWTMTEDFDSSISVLCDNCGYYGYSDEPIGGEL